MARSCGARPGASIVERYAASSDRGVRGGVKVRPQFPEVQQNLGLALGRAGRIDAAREHFETARRLDPQLKPASDLLERFKSGSATPKP